MLLNLNYIFLFIVVIYHRNRLVSSYYFYLPRKNLTWYSASSVRHRSTVITKMPPCVLFILGLTRGVLVKVGEGCLKDQAIDAINRAME